AGVLALEETAEKPFLQPHAVVAIEVREVRIAVYLEPLLLRARGEEAFVVAARMQPLPAPVRGGEQRRLDAPEVDHARAVVVIHQAACARLAAGIRGVLRQHVRRQRLRSRNRLAGDAALRAPLADAVLHAKDLALVPSVDEATQDPAVARQLSVVI